MSNKIVEGVVYFFALILSDLLGYKLVPLEKLATTTTSTISVESTSTILNFETSTKDIASGTKIIFEIKNPTSTLFITTSASSSEK
ncbi:hypothetical protein HRbin35_00574 [bacterium HR35]|nr:hypothetical protein HRbin35_00574 [bacterium HR35]